MIAPPCRGDLLAPLLMALLILGGCSTIPPKSDFRTRMDSKTMSAAELDLALFEFVLKTTYAIERAADRIHSRTDEQQVRLRCLEWKLKVPPALRIATLYREPGASLIDLWALTVQMRTYLEFAGGKEYFGSDQEVAVETMKEAETRIMNIARQVFRPEGFSEMEERISAWVEDNPGEDALYSRASVRGLYGQIAGTSQGDAFVAIGQIDRGIEDIGKRLSVQAELLPSIFRWEAEQYLAETLAPSLDKQVSEPLEALNETLISLTQSLDQRIAVTMEDVDRQRLETLSEIDRQREVTLEQAANASTSALSNLQVLVASEKAELASLVQKERREVRQSLADLANLARADAEAIAFASVDRLFVKGIWLLGLLCLGFLAFALGISRYYRSRQRNPHKAN